MERTPTSAKQLRELIDAANRLGLTIDNVEGYGTWKTADGERFECDIQLTFHGREIGHKWLHIIHDDEAIRAMPVRNHPQSPGGIKVHFVDPKQREMVH